MGRIRCPDPGLDRITLVGDEVTPAVLFQLSVGLAAAIAVGIVTTIAIGIETVRIVVGEVAAASEAEEVRQRLPLRPGSDRGALRTGAAPVRGPGADRGVRRGDVNGQYQDIRCLCPRSL